MNCARHHSHLYFLIPMMFLVSLAARASIDNASRVSNRDTVPSAPRDADTDAGDDALAPAFTPIPELTSGFQLLYAQQFPQAREKFTNWEAEHPQEPFGEVAVAASYLFEEFYRQGVLTSDFFLNEEKFLNGIDGKPDPGRMAQFQGALVRTRTLANKRLKQRPRDTEALFALTLAAGMESDADMILRKERLEALKLLKLANQYAKQLLAVRPDANDAFVALGSANYIIGSLSGGMRFFLAFGGVHGDKKLGMQQLGKSADSGLYLRPFAKIMLALAARREKQDALAQKLLRELSEEFSSSPLFAAEYAKSMGRPVPAVMHP
ncbi:MAG TPA: hypothetical protein VFF42_07720 [Candidatus Eremiobacteraceae bacterium]|nr:hypothetical protein [Candidatus Eremiobacteraceae bacterium]